MVAVLAAIPLSTQDAVAHKKKKNGNKHCTPGYSKCLHPASDWDCYGGGGDGPRYMKGTTRVTGSDPYGLDANNNGVGCEDG